MIKHSLALLFLLGHFSFEVIWLNALLGPHASNIFFAGHGLLSWACAFGIYPYFKARFKIPWHSLSFLGVFIPLLLLPMFGSLLLLLAALSLLFIQKEREIPFSSQNEDQELFSMFEFGTPEQTEQELSQMILGELEIEPYIDILKRGDVELKKGVIQKLSEIVSPASVKLLKIALSDDHPETRLMASKALSSLEEDIHDDILTLSSKIEHENKNIETRNQLGSIYFRYATLGLLDSSTQKFYFEKAMHEFLVSLQLNMRQEEILMQVGKILLMTQNHKKAQEIFKRILDLNPESVQAHLDLCDAYLGNRDFESIQQECRKIKNIGRTQEYQELLDHWTSPKEATP